MDQLDENRPGEHGASADTLSAGGSALPASGRPPAGRRGRLRAAAASRWARELAVLAAFLAAGVAATWPLSSYITGRLPASRDVAIYVWDMWWVAHQIIHLHNPWSTTYLAAPVGLQLGYHTLVPLLGALMAPVTLAFGPSASYNLLIIVLPGLACYAMYRAARLWLPTQTGAIAAGAFFGLSAMLTYQGWYHLNIAYGTVFLPLTLEAAVRLRRGPTIGRGVILGAVLGASALVNQESAVMALILAALVLIPWLVGSRALVLIRLRALAAAVVAAVVVASPQLAAMIEQARAGGNAATAASLGYTSWVANLPSLFAPSPRLGNYGLTGLGGIYTSKTHFETLNTFGVVLSALAVLGLIASWRRRSAWLLALLWLGGAALALGPVLYIGAKMYMPLAQTWEGLRVSAAMPYTWFIRVPGLSIFREADRLALLGLVGAALLAGAAVDWLRRHRAWPLILAVAVLGAAARRAGREPPEDYRRCLPRWLPWMARSPPTIPARSSWMCRSAWTTSRPTAKSPSPRPSSSRPPTATPGRSATRPGCPRRPSRRSSAIRSTPSSTRPSRAGRERRRRSRRPGQTCGR